MTHSLWKILGSRYWKYLLCAAFLLIGSGVLRGAGVVQDWHRDEQYVKKTDMKAVYKEEMEMKGGKPDVTYEEFVAKELDQSYRAEWRYSIVDNFFMTLLLVFLGFFVFLIDEGSHFKEFLFTLGESRRKIYWYKVIMQIGGVLFLSFIGKISYWIIVKGVVPSEHLSGDLSWLRILHDAAVLSVKEGLLVVILAVLGLVFGDLKKASVWLFICCFSFVINTGFGDPSEYWISKLLNIHHGFEGYFYIILIVGILFAGSVLYQKIQLEYSGEMFLIPRLKMPAFILMVAYFSSVSLYWTNVSVTPLERSQQIAEAAGNIVWFAVIVVFSYILVFGYEGLLNFGQKLQRKTARPRPSKQINCFTVQRKYVSWAVVLAALFMVFSNLMTSQRAVSDWELEPTFSMNEQSFESNEDATSHFDTYEEYEQAVQQSSKESPAIPVYQGILVKLVPLLVAFMLLLLEPYSGYTGFFFSVGEKRSKIYWQKLQVLYIPLLIAYILAEAALYLPIFMQISVADLGGLTLKMILPNIFLDISLFALLLAGVICAGILLGNFFFACVTGVFAFIFLGRGIQTIAYGVDMLLATFIQNDFYEKMAAVQLVTYQNGYAILSYRFINDWGIWFGMAALLLAGLVLVLGSWLYAHIALETSFEPVKVPRAKAYVLYGGTICSGIFFTFNSYVQRMILTSPEYRDNPFWAITLTGVLSVLISYMVLRLVTMGKWQLPIRKKNSLNR